jgi:hypothetical protein
MWLDPMLQVAGADVLVVLGAVARAVITEYLDICDTTLTLWGPCVVAGRTRCVAFLPHPSRQHSSLVACLPAEKRRAVQEFLTARVPGPPDPPDPKFLARDLRRLGDPKGRELLAYLAERKGYWFEHRGGSPEFGASLRQAAVTIRQATGMDDEAAVGVVIHHVALLANQEAYDQDNDVGVFKKNFGAYLADGS